MSDQSQRAGMFAAFMRRKSNDAGPAQNILEKYHMEKSEFDTGVRLFEFENRLKDIVSKIEHDAALESKKTGKKVVAENPFEDGEMTKMFTDQLKSVVTDARHMNKQMLEVQIGRMDKMMKNLSESDLSQKKFLEDEYQKSLDFIKDQHAKRSGIITRSMSTVSGLAEEYLDIQSIYSGFVNHNPIMMGLFRVGSDIIKKNRVKKQEQKKLEAEDAHKLLMAQKLEKRRQEVFEVEARRQEEIDGTKKESAKTESENTKKEKKEKKGKTGGFKRETVESVQAQIDEQMNFLKTNVLSVAPKDRHAEILERDVKLQDLQTRLEEVKSGKNIESEEVEKVPKIKKEPTDKQKPLKDILENESPPAIQKAVKSSIPKTVFDSNKQDENKERRMERATQENHAEDKQDRKEANESLFERLDTIIDLLKENVDNTQDAAASGGDGIMDNVAQAAMGGKLKGLAAGAAGLLGGKKLLSLGKGAAGLGAGLLGLNGIGDSVQNKISPNSSKKKGGFSKLLGAGKGLGGKALSKLVPGLGLAVGGKLAYDAYQSGDFVGAAGNLLSGGLSMIPVVGTAASLAIDAGLAARDGGFTKESGDGALLSQIAKGEGTNDKKAKEKGYKSGYDVTLGYGAFDPPGYEDKNLSEMTLGEVKKFQSGMLKHPENDLDSSAVGKYQIVRKTLLDLQKGMGLSDSDVFSPELQDKMAMALMKRRGLEKVKSGEITPEQFQDNLSKEWASIATSSTGESHYNQHTGTSSGEIQGAIQVATTSNLESAPPRASLDRVSSIENSVSEINTRKQEIAANQNAPIIAPTTVNNTKVSNGGASSGGGIMPLGSARNPDSSIQRVTDRFTTFSTG